jgi:hypothetical protein
MADISEVIISEASATFKALKKLQWFNGTGLQPTSPQIFLR